MDSIKTEPDTDGELYSASYSDRQHIDIEGKLRPVLVSFPQMKTLYIYIYIYSDDFDSCNEGSICKNLIVVCCRAKRF
jgi:hypothetical protein